MIKDRTLKVAFAALVALAIPTVAVLAHAPADPRGGPAAATEDVQEAAPAASGAPAARPHNHGWFVSQAAKDRSSKGRAHGAAVSKIARGEQGKASTAGH
jgi:hypothetical protein